MQGVMNGFIQVGEWITRFAVTNVLWIFVNIPVLLVVTSMYMTGSSGLMPFYIALLMVLGPLLFFPATAALFASVRDFVMQKESKSLIVRYFKLFAENYRRSAAGGALLTVLWLIWAVDYYYFSGSSVILMFAFLGMVIPLFVFTMNFFVVLAHFDMPVRKLLRKALLLTFGNIKMTAITFAVSFVIFYVSVNGALFLLLFFSVSITAFFIFSLFYRYYARISGEAVSQ
jgi:uncharacterized membrane protein YesL